MTWQENLEKQTEGRIMRAFITGWIFVILSIGCVIGYIFLPEFWKAHSPTLLVGWWLFAAGFFIAGIIFLYETLTTTNSN